MTERPTRLPGPSGYEACRGCYKYTSGKGCETYPDCWMKRAAPYGTGPGRKGYTGPTEFWGRQKKQAAPTK